MNSLTLTEPITQTQALRQIRELLASGTDNLLKQHQIMEILNAAEETTRVKRKEAYARRKLRKKSKSVRFYTKEELLAEVSKTVAAVVLAAGGKIVIPETVMQEVNRTTLRQSRNTLDKSITLEVMR